MTRLQYKVCRFFKVVKSTYINLLLWSSYDCVLGVIVYKIGHIYSQTQVSLMLRDTAYDTHSVSGFPREYFHLILRDIRYDSVSCFREQQLIILTS